MLERRVFVRLDGAFRDGKGAFSLADVKMQPTGGRRLLEPAPREPDGVGHCKELVWRVSPHVAHEHPSMRVLCGIDVDGHERQADQALVVQLIGIIREASRS